MGDRNRRGKAGASCTSALIFPLSLFSTQCVTALTQQSKPPNFAVVIADDLGTYDLSVNGHPSIRTPHLDAMAREGALFTQWVSAAPICTPSRSSLYTGRLPIRTGLYADAVQQPQGKPANASHFGLDAWQRKDGAGGLPQTEITLPELLGQHGYVSLLVGKWHLGQVAEFWPRNHGFSRYLGTISTHDHGTRDGLSFAMSGWPCLLQGGFREPGIIRYPPLAKGGQRFSQLASTMDIFVTVLELAGVAPPARPLDGKSLVPVLRDNAASGHTDYFYWRGNAVFAMRHGDFKLHFFTQGCTDYWFPSLEQHEPPLLFNLLLDPAEAYPVRGML